MLRQMDPAWLPPSIGDRWTMAPVCAPRSFSRAAIYAVSGVIIQRLGPIDNGSIGWRKIVWPAANAVGTVVIICMHRDQLLHLPAVPVVVRVWKPAPAGPWGSPVAG
jgi:hypothetical protein